MGVECGSISGRYGVGMNKQRIRFLSSRPEVAGVSPADGEPGDTWWWPKGTVGQLPGDTVAQLTSAQRRTHMKHLHAIS